jgi:hypothetical protein
MSEPLRHVRVNPKKGVQIMKKQTATVLKWGGAIIIAVGLCYVILLISASRSLRCAYAALEADGRPMKAEQIIPAKIPDADNAALIYKAVVLQLKSEKAGEKDLFSELDALASTLLKEPTNVVVKTQFSQLSQTPAASEALKTVRKGSDKPGCQFDLDYMAPFSFKYSHLTELRNLTRILCGLALLQAEDGAQDSAWQTIRCCFSLANATRDEPLIVSQLIRASLFSLANDTLHALAVKAPPSRLQIDEMDRLLRNFEDKDRFVTALDGERLFFGEPVFKLKSSEVINNLAGTSENEGFDYYMRRTIFKAFFASPLGIYDHAAYLTMMREYTQIATKLPVPGGSNSENVLLNNLRPYHILTRMLLPATTSTLERIGSMNAQARVTRAGLAVLKYRQEKGALPNGLSDLGMGDLLDPFSDKPLIYKATPAGFILYSVGANLTDDNGTTSKKKLLGDLVWSYPESTSPSPEQQ